MKRTLATLIALSTVAAALPAAAQPWRDDGRYGDRFRGDTGQAERLERRIDFLRERGGLNRRDAQTLYRQVDMVRRTEWEYQRDGLNQWERRDLDRRYGAIDYRVRYFMENHRDRDGWGYGRR